MDVGKGMASRQWRVKTGVIQHADQLLHLRHPRPRSHSRTIGQGIRLSSLSRIRILLPVQPRRVIAHLRAIWRYHKPSRLCARPARRLGAATRRETRDRGLNVGELLRQGAVGRILRRVLCGVFASQRRMRRAAAAGAAIHGIENRPMPRLVTIVILIPVIRVCRQDSAEHHHTHQDSHEDWPQHDSLLWLKRSAAGRVA